MYIHSNIIDTHIGNAHIQQCTYCWQIDNFLTVKNIFTINPSQKRSMSGRMDSAHVRDSSLAILAKELFIDFLPKLKVSSLTDS